VSSNDIHKLVATANLNEQTLDSKDRKTNNIMMTKQLNLLKKCKNIPWLHLIMFFDISLF
jgi:hypothetical protein